MPRIWIESPIAEALAQTVSLLGANNNIACRKEFKEKVLYRILSYKEDFDYLWGIESGGTDIFFNTYNEEQYNISLVIIDDGIPECPSCDHVNLSGFIGPLDWAISLSLWIDKKAKINGRYPKLSIFIVRSGGGRASIFLESKFGISSKDLGIAERFPWIQVVDLQSIFKIGQRDFPLSLLTNQLGLGSQVIDMAFTLSGDVGVKLSLVKKLMQFGFRETSQQYDRHSIANVLGIIFFFNDSELSGQMRAIKKLMSVLDLLPEIQSDLYQSLNTFPWIDWQSSPWAEIIRRMREGGCYELNFHLVDDFALNQGWDKILAKALDISNAESNGASFSVSKEETRPGDNLDFRLFCYTDAEQLIDSLNRASDKYGLLAKDEEWERGADILFLDLRLYSAQDIRREAEFIKKLCAIASRFKSGTENLPWPGFSEEELDDIQRFFEDSSIDRRSPVYIRSLTLLPRIVALSDPSLPVVIFSSTGRREIVEILKPYGNLITDFEKPRFFESIETASEIIEKAKSLFRMALFKALNLAVAQSLCRKISKSATASSTLESELRNIYKSAFRSDVPWHIEVFLDETGETLKKIKIGGILAIFPPTQDPDQLNGTLYSKYIDEHGDNKIRKKGGKEYLRTNREEISANINDEVRRCGIHLVAIGLSGAIGDAVYTDINRHDELHDERVADNLYRELFRCLIETAIYTYARFVIPAGAPVTFSVRAATRHVPPREPIKKYLDRLRQKWGLQSDYVGDNAAVWKAVEHLSKIRTEEKGKPIQSILSELSGVFLKLFYLAKEKENISEPPRLIRFIGFDSVRPFVEEIMREYRESRFEPIADEVRAYPLNSSESATKISFLHYFADAILGDEANRGANIHDLWKRGYESHYGNRLQGMLNAQRLILKQLIPEGIKAGYCAIRNAVEAASNIELLLMNTIYQAIMEMDGEEFIRLAGLLSEERNFSVKNIAGIVTNKKEKYLFICDDRSRIFFAHKENCEDFVHLHVNDYVEFEGKHSMIPGDYVAKRVKKIVSPRNED
jgi:hypothetical protein